MHLKILAVALAITATAGVATAAAATIPDPPATPAVDLPVNVYRAGEIPLPCQDMLSAESRTIARFVTGALTHGDVTALNADGVSCRSALNLLP